MSRTSLNARSSATLQILIILAGLLLIAIAIGEFANGQAGVSAWINIVLWPVLTIIAVVNLVRARGKG